MKIIYVSTIFACAAFGGVAAGQATTKSPYLHNDVGMRSLRSASDSDFDRKFMSQSIEHHRGSIDLSRRALTVAKRATTKSLARQVIERDEHEIRVLKGLLQKMYRAGPLASEERIVRNDMAERMNSPILTDKDYARRMIRHEEEEVQMGQLVRKRTSRKELVDMAQRMVAHSRQAIQQFIEVFGQ